jgi:hypothetical protein
MKNHWFIQCTEVDIKGLKKNVEGVLTQCYMNGSNVRRKRKPKRYLSLLAECPTLNSFSLSRRNSLVELQQTLKKVKVKLSRYRPEQALGDPVG